MKTKFSGFLTLLLALVVQIGFAQEQEVSGTVKGDQGLPLPGVNITVVGTNSGTQTDFDGHYEIKVDQGASLKFSFVGFQDQTIKVGTQTTINVVMKKGEVLGVVEISTGYQTQTKRESSKSVSTITAEDIQDRPNASAVDALQGQVAGLNIGSNSGQPGSSSTVLLRGVGSINGNISPLYVIDGIPSSQTAFTNLNPNNIQSVSVLKGPNATSIYGNRGANGVIVVTTTSGKYNEKMTFKYSSQYGLSKVMPLNVELMNSKEKLTFLRDNGFGMPAIAGLHANMTDAEIDAFAKHTDTYWADFFFRTAKTNRQNLTITSGSENMSNATSISYTDQDGVFLPSDLKRFTFANNFQGKSSNGKFHYNTHINASFSKKNYNPNAPSQNSIFFNPFLEAEIGLPMVSPYDPDGSRTLTGGMAYGDPAALDAERGPIVLLNSAAMNTQYQEQFRLLAGMHADWNFIDHFTAGVNVNVNYGSFNYRNITNPLSLLGPFQMGFNGNAKFGGIDQEQHSRDVRFTTRTNLSYQNTWGKHSLGVNLYTEYHKNFDDLIGYVTRGLDPKLVGTDDAFNIHVKDDPNQTGTPTEIYADNTDLFLTNITTGLFSYFATVDYDFDQRLGFSGSIRRDASFRFTDKNQWGTFWSVSGRWNIDQEEWMQNTAFNMLKLRAGYGTSGNQRILNGFYDGLQLFRNTYTAGTGYNATSSYVPSNIANPNLKWETSKQADIGVDFGIWKNKLNGSIDVYSKKTVDLYMPRPVSLVNATSSISDNVGSMENKGVEVNLKYNIIDSKDWRLSIFANGAYNHNKVLKIAGANEDGIIRNGSQSLAQDQSFGEYFSVRYAGVNPANGRALFYNKNGNLTQTLDDADRVYRNLQSIPEIQGGFGATLSYKGFTLSQNWVYFAHVWRNNWDLNTLESKANFVQFNTTTSLFDAWDHVGQLTSIPKLDDPNQYIDYANISDRYIENASYLRLRTVSLGYTFKKDQLKRLPFTSVKLYVQGENLLTFTDFQGYDPESDYRGYEQTRYPSMKTYTVGLNVNF